MTLPKSGFVPRTQSFFWTSRSSDARGAQCGDHVSVPISGFGCFGIAAEAARFSWKRSPTTQITRTSTYSATLRNSGDSSRTQLREYECGLSFRREVAFRSISPSLLRRLFANGRLNPSLSIQQHPSLVPIEGGPAWMNSDRYDIDAQPLGSPSR
jgi:hypothetical protein